MTQKTHKRIYAVLNAFAIVGTFEGLLAILNLNQPELFFKTAFYAGFFFILQVALIYDLHFRDRKTSGAAFLAMRERFSHLLDWKFIKLWFSYLILPGLIYWGSLCIFFVNFGFPKVQQAVVVFSSVAFFINYIYLKEIFSRGREAVDRDIFIILSVVKIYAAVLVYGASLAMVKNYCLNEFYFVFGVLALTFLLIYQALFQHRLVSIKNLGLTFLISLAMAMVSYLIIVFWNFNYFTAAVFLTACYNLLWGIFHYHLDRALTWKAFWEILVISIIVAAMLFGATNFKAKIFNGCEYDISL